MVKLIENYNCNYGRAKHCSEFKSYFDESGQAKWNLLFFNFLPSSGISSCVHDDVTPLLAHPVSGI